MNLFQWIATKSAKIAEKLMSCTWISVLKQPDWASNQYFDALQDEMDQGLSLSDTTISELLPRARETLDEVKHLTEYEDQKASRILAAMAFLSALAGLIYNRLDSLMLVDTPAESLGSDFMWGALSYALSISLFYVYAGLIVVGAFYTLYAIAPRFRVPENWGHGSKKVKSPLFFSKIIESSPRNWIRFFYGGTPEDVLRSYYGAYVYESYLIAEKVSHKYRILNFGVKIFISAVAVFFIWLASLAVYLF